MQQKRLALALVISTAILFLWSYFVPVKNPQTNPVTATATPVPVQQPSPSPQISIGADKPAVSNSQLEKHRTILVKTPLYEATFDSQGGEVISWIIKKNKDSGNGIFSVGPDKRTKFPLELISQEGLHRQPRSVPLQVETGDPSVDDLLRSRNYRVDEVNGLEETTELDLTGSENKKLTFVFQDDASGVYVSKALTFQADQYNIGLEVTLKHNNQPVPQAKLKIGPSIGDQGVTHFSFYSVAPESVSFVDNKAERHSAQSINEKKGSPDLLQLPGPVDWAGVGDTYFAMVALPSQRSDGL